MGVAPLVQLPHGNASARYWHGVAEPSSVRGHKLLFLHSTAFTHASQDEQLTLLAEVASQTGSLVVLCGRDEKQEASLSRSLSSKGATVVGATPNYELCLQEEGRDEITAFMEAYTAGTVAKWVELRGKTNAKPPSGDEHCVEAPEGLTPQKAQELHLKLSG